MRTCLFAVMMFVASPVLAQELPDSGLPDASVGQGGADQTSEENDTAGGPCLTSKDCGQAFTCENARCVPVQPKTVGCNVTPLGGVLVAGLAWLLRRRRS